VSPRLFMLALALIALVAALLTPPHLVQLVLGTPIPAGQPPPLSLGANGVTGVLGYAARHGVEVSIGYLAQLNSTVGSAESLLVYIPSPEVCPPGRVAELRSTLQALAARGVRVAVLVTGAGKCGMGVVEGVAPGVTLVTVESVGGLGVGVYRCGGLHYFVFQNFSHIGFSARGGVRAELLAVGLTGGLERPKPLGYLFETASGVRVAYLAAGVFTNGLLNVSRAVGLSAEKEFLELIRCLAGRRPVLFVPLDFYTFRSSVRVVNIYVDPGAAIASSLYQLESLERRLLRASAILPPLFFALAGTAVLVVALALPPLRRGGAEGGGVRSSQLLGRLLGRFGILYGGEAVRAVEEVWAEAEAVLRALAGVGVEDAARGLVGGSLFEAAVMLRELRRRVARGKVRLVRRSEVERVRRLLADVLEGRAVEWGWSRAGGAAGGQGAR
jgi:hypothetical protein